MTFDELQSLIEKLFISTGATQAVFSQPVESRAAVTKVTLRPIVIKGSPTYQATRFFASKTVHANYSLKDVKQLIIKELIPSFKNTVLFSDEADYHILVSAKKKITLLKKKPTKKGIVSAHNRPKKFLLPEDVPHPFLVDLGIMNLQGKVIAGKSNKFKQINRFLEIVADLLEHCKTQNEMQIVDFGCGKAYLTFALYHYLRFERQIPVRIHGLDLKADVVADCTAISERLRYEGLTFQVGDIGGYHADHPIDMVVALHACDRATDAALAQAVRWNAQVIMAVPCCQHELFNQIDNAEMIPLLRHGVLKERFAALATDAARANLLEMQGYKTQVMEFIDLEHTPKNLLIRAVKKDKPDLKREGEYHCFKQLLGFDIALERYLKERSQ